MECNRIIMAALAASIIGIAYSLLGYSLPLNPDEDCPHEMFVNKHLCVDCNSIQEALAFSRRRQAYGGTNVNTVFFGSSQFESKQAHGESVCVNTTPLKAVKCTINTNHCFELGQNCHGEHAVSNGHLFYQAIRC
ncbi:Uncharacterized protein FKW44_014285 [Caligus rogercresseyi]|uniref:Uncharacterized protein n=1 Tax=Caligus rogercresseyi TaxID=217165 RepID=A0A7T8GZJ9_CALRO|nr:Uncharacterized protein FKW44_014285 [Caligus rogercresseyi]